MTADWLHAVCSSLVAYYLPYTGKVTLGHVWAVQYLIQQGMYEKAILKLTRHVRKKSNTQANKACMDSAIHKLARNVWTVQYAILKPTRHV